MAVFSWKDVASLADYLADNATAGKPLENIAEATLRSAISRYYYTSYHHAREYCVAKLGYSPKGNVEDHTGVRATLYWSNERLCNVLDRLRKWRNDCDYHAAVGDLNQMLSKAKADSAFVIMTLDQELAMR